MSIRKCLVGLVLLFSVSVASGDTFFEGFDSYTPGIVPPDPPWKLIQMANGVTIKVDDQVYFGSSGKSVHFEDNNLTGGGSLLQRAFEPASSIVLEYYMRSDNEAHEGAFVMLQLPFRGSASRFPRISFLAGRPAALRLIT